MGLRSGFLAALLFLGACAEDAASTTSQPPAATGLTTPGTIGVVADGVRWELPATACTHSPGDAAAVATQAAQTAAEVEDLVARRVSGWPTTTMAPPGDDAAFFVAVNRSGPTALALGMISGTAADIEATWSAFENGYAGNGWGPVTDIAVRLTGWKATAAAIVEVVPVACAAAG
jgi:hypothetical protein